jgi:hypothetical protein
MIGIACPSSFTAFDIRLAKIVRHDGRQHGYLGGAHRVTSLAWPISTSPGMTGWDQMQAVP